MALLCPVQGEWLRECWCGWDKREKGKLMSPGRGSMSGGVGDEGGVWGQSVLGGAMGLLCPCGILELFGLEGALKLISSHPC